MLRRALNVAGSSLGRDSGRNVVCLVQARSRTAIALVPPVMLAHSYKPGMDAGGWYWSEKLDGIRAYWTGQDLITRNGNVLNVPKGFKSEMRRYFKSARVDGELFATNDRFQQTMSAVMRHTEKNPTWNLRCGASVQFVAFDLPKPEVPFVHRLRDLRAIGSTMSESKPKFVRVHKYGVLPKSTERARETIQTQLVKVLAQHGEGLMIRHPMAKYVDGRSEFLLKVKNFEDSEALVTGFADGTGRFDGLVGALHCTLLNGVRFYVGSGLVDRNRFDEYFGNKVITVRHQGFTDTGVPRFPTFVGVRLDRCPSEFKALGKAIQNMDNARTMHM